MKNIFIRLIALGALAALCACSGGGGGGGGGGAPPGNGKWDQMVWDQDKWS